MRSEKCLSPHSRNAIASARLAALADELGAVERELAPLKFLFARAEKLRSEIRSKFKDEPTERTFEIRGKKFVVHVGTLQGAGVPIQYISPGYRVLKVEERPEERQTLSPPKS